MAKRTPTKKDIQDLKEMVNILTKKDIEDLKEIVTMLTELSEKHVAKLDWFESRLAHIEKQMKLSKLPDIRKFVAYLKSLL